MSFVDAAAAPDLARPQASLVGRAILQVIPALETGGAERTTLEVAAAIIAAGGRAVVASAGGPMVAELEASGAVHVALPLGTKSPVGLWQNRQQLRALIAAQYIDIVHARSRAPAWSALWAARASGVPFVTTYHGIYRARGAAKRLYNSVMARGDRVIANSAFTAAAIIDTYGEAAFFDPACMVTIPRGAELSRFDPAALDENRRDAAMAAFGGAGALRLLLPGRLTAWKGQRVALAAAGLLHRANPARPFRLVFAGSAQGRDNYEAELRAMIAEQGLTGMVHVHGHVEDMPAAYDWAEIVLSTSSRPEAFGRVIVEAMAMGRPVIASAHGGALETVIDGVTGKLVAIEDPAALAHAIETLADQAPAATAGMAAAARDRAVRHFSTQAMTAATLSVYNSLMGAAIGQRGA